MHLLIPFAHSQSPGCQEQLAGLELPHLSRLMAALTASSSDLGDEATLTPPHERALARARGLSTSDHPAIDGAVPWGAWHALKAGLHTGTAGSTDAAWAVITPAQWAVQTNHITMADPLALRLTEADSRALLDLMAPYFNEDGIRLVYDSPTRWLASGEVFRGLVTASIDRVVGRHVDDWLPKAAAAKTLRRLQQEMQMLLYTHPLTETRAAQGLPAVNSFWVSGTGPLVPDARADSSSDSGADVLYPTALRDAAVNEDWPAWARAWQHIDAHECAAALAALQRSEPLSLTLCGDRNALRLERGKPGASAWLRAKLARFSSLSGHQVNKIMRDKL